MDLVIESLMCSLGFPKLLTLKLIFTEEAQLRVQSLIFRKAINFQRNRIWFQGLKLFFTAERNYFWSVTWRDSKRTPENVYIPRPMEKQSQLIFEFTAFFATNATGHQVLSKLCQ